MGLGQAAIKPSFFKNPLYQLNKTNLRKGHPFFEACNYCKKLQIDCKCTVLLKKTNLSEPKSLPNPLTQTGNTYKFKRKPPSLEKILSGKQLKTDYQ
jgi:hypothetical protein